MQVDEMLDVEIMPPHLDNTYIRPPGIIAPDLIKFDHPPSNNLSEYDRKNNRIQFTLNTSSNLLDPYSLYFDFEIENNNSNPIQFDNSAHSIISEIVVLSNGQVIEKISDYDFLMALQFDLQLNKKQRKKRKEFEGFGDNRWGTNETIIPPKKSMVEDKLFNNVYAATDTYGIQAVNLSLGLPIKETGADVLIKSEDSNVNNKILDFPILSSLDYQMPDLKDWNYVVDGRLSPFPINSKMFSETRNVKKFRLPLMLKTIGFGQQPNNYKLVPLELFGLLTIVITLNPDAFFVPKKLKEHEYFGSVKYISENSSHLSALDTDKNPTTSAWKLLRPLIKSEQYRFSHGIHSKILNQVRAGGWVLDYIDMEIIDQVYCKDYPTHTYTKAIARNNIKSIYIAFTNDLYRASPYARKLARYNRGISNIFFKQAGAQYPPDTNSSHNSLTSHGKTNAQFFFNELLKSFGRNNIEDESLINLTNFCLDYDSSHAWAIQHLVNSKLNSHVSSKDYESLGPISNANGYTDFDWSEKYLSVKKAEYMYNSMIKPPIQYLSTDYNLLNKNIDNVTSKCIYALNFETAPHSAGLYRTGISTSYNVPFVLDVVRLSDYLYQSDSTWTKLKQIYFFQWIIFEYYTTIQLTPNGIFVKTQ